MSSRVILITGSSSGIGATCATIAAKNGYNVVITGRNGDGLATVKKECLAAGRQDHEVLVVVGDVTCGDFRKELVEKTIKQFGHLDVLVNNAGIPMVGDLESSGLEKLDKVMNVNVRSVVDLTKLCIPYLVETKGNIVNVSSIASTAPSPGFMFYCMSKAALDMFTKCVALELAPKKVRVNAVNPAIIRTPIFGKMNQPAFGDNPHANPEFLAAMGKMHPLGRVGEPEEVAELILFLASDKAAFITGTCMLIDGGRSIDASVAIDPSLQDKSH